MKKVLIFLFVFKNLIYTNILEFKGQKLNLSQHCYILEDKNNKIKEEEIIKGLYDKKFSKYNYKNLDLKNPNITYWIRISIKNISNEEKLVILSENKEMNFRGNLVYFYLEDKNKESKEILNEKQKEYLTKYYINLKIKKQMPKTIYLKVTGKQDFVVNYLNYALENKSNLKLNLTLDTFNASIGKAKTISYLLLNLANIAILFLTIFIYIKTSKKYYIYFLFFNLISYINSPYFLDLDIIRKLIFPILDTSDLVVIQLFLRIFSILFLIPFIMNVLDLNIKNKFMYGFLFSLQILFLISLSFLALSLYISYALKDTSKSTLFLILLAIDLIHLVSINAITLTGVINFRNNLKSKLFLIGWLPYYIYFNYIPYKSTNIIIEQDKLYYVLLKSLAEIFIVLPLSILDIIAVNKKSNLDND